MLPLFSKNHERVSLFSSAGQLRSFYHYSTVFKKWQDVSKRKDRRDIPSVFCIASLLYFFAVEDLSLFLNSYHTCNQNAVTVYKLGLLRVLYKTAQCRTLLKCCLQLLAGTKLDNAAVIYCVGNIVKQTAKEALVLVFLVVFIFLQNWRATLIPCVAVPVSVIGTFAGM
ncbi:MAG: efflux RND transporter permease subunit, partial [Clostridia bacterium]|nr:efflux RND transporter permease subunit [Clostridia bacterium]